MQDDTLLIARGVTVTYSTDCRRRRRGRRRGGI